MSQNITLNGTPGLFMPTFYYSQGDVGREFVITVEGFTIPSGATVNCVATKPSGFGFTVAGTVSDNTVTFETTEAMTDEWGRFPAELQITYNSDVIGTSNFYMQGEASPHPDGTVDGQQETIIPQLTLLVERVETAASNILDMTVTATTLAAGSDATYSYDEETNTATFGIPRGADGSLASGVLASTYSSSSTYAVGDYVYYSGDLYRCTTEITTAEAWTAGHWTEVALADEVASAKKDLNALDTELSGDISDLNNQLTNATSGKVVPLTSGCIDTHGNTVDITSITTSASYGYAIVDVTAGDVFTINGAGDAYFLLWCFIDADGVPLNRSAASATGNNTVIVAPALSDKLVINTYDQSKNSYYGYLPSKEKEITDSKAALESDRVSAIQEQLDGYIDLDITLAYGVFEASGYASPATVKYVHTQILTAGSYIITPPSGYQCEIYKYNSDTSGTSSVAWFTGRKIVNYTTQIVLSFTKSPTVDIITKAEFAALGLAISIKKFAGFPSLLKTVNENSRAHWNPKFTADHSFESLFTIGNYASRTGKTEKVYDKTFQDAPYAVKFCAETTVQTNNEFRINMPSAFNLVGVSEFMLPVYVSDPTKVSGIGLTVEKPSGTAWSRSVNGSTLKAGWNYIRLYTIDSTIAAWATSTLFRVLCSYASGVTPIDVYVADIIAVRPNKAKIIFVDDHGYSNFYSVAYPQLKALGVPVTWAIQPGALGASGGVSGKLTQAEIDVMANDPFCEFSFHSWQSDATASMTDAEIMDDVQKCVTYLKKNGILPTYFWRAAWTQNKATNAAASQYILKAYATPNDHYGYYNYPFRNRFDITRYQLHGNASFDSLFNFLAKTHCTAIVYTHDIAESGGIHITPDEFSAFVSALSDALDDGYVECTSYSRLCTKYGDNEPYLIT